VYCTSTEGFTLAHQNVGYLTSDYTRSTDIGAKRCPWRIVAQVRAVSLCLRLSLFLILTQQPNYDSVKEAFKQRELWETIMEQSPVVNTTPYIVGLSTAQFRN